MDVQDLEGRIVKISAHTITVKDEAGKTRGMVRDVRPWKEIPLNRQTDIFRSLKAAGAWGAIETTRVFWDNGTFWYIKNDHSRLYWGDNPPDIARPEIGREETHAQLAAAAGLQVVTVSKILS